MSKLEKQMAMPRRNLCVARTAMTWKKTLGLFFMTLPLSGSAVYTVLPSGWQMFVEAFAFCATVVGTIGIGFWLWYS